MDKVALVNGAGSELGRAIAVALALAGHRICATDADGPALRDTALAVGRERVVALIGHPGDVDLQDDAIERALSAFSRIDVLVNVVDPATVRALIEARPAATAGLLGWVEKVNLAAEPGGRIVTVFTPPATAAGRWPPPVAERLSRLGAELQERLGSGGRAVALLPPPTGSATVNPAPRPVMPLLAPASVPEVVGYLLTRRGQALAGRTLRAENPAAPWTVVDAPLGGSALRDPEVKHLSIR